MPRFASRILGLTVLAITVRNAAAQVTSTLFIPVPGIEDDPTTTEIDFAVSEIGVGADGRTTYLVGAAETDSEAAFSFTYAVGPTDAGYTFSLDPEDQATAECQIAGRTAFCVEAVTGVVTTVTQLVQGIPVIVNGPGAAAPGTASTTAGASTIAPTASSPAPASSPSGTSSPTGVVPPASKSGMSTVSQPTMAPSGSTASSPASSVTTSKGNSAFQANAPTVGLAFSIALAMVLSVSV